MAEVAVPSNDIDAPADSDGHLRWVRVCHWIVVAGFFTLAVSGIFILMVYPRLHWGEVGNDLMPSILDLPISGNHRPDEYGTTTQFSATAGGPVSANRNYEIFNQNGWARSLHFLAAWLLVATGVIYVTSPKRTGTGGDVERLQGSPQNTKQGCPRRAAVWSAAKTHLLHCDIRGAAINGDHGAVDGASDYGAVSYPVGCVWRLPIGTHDSLFLFRGIAPVRNRTRRHGSNDRILETGACDDIGEIE